jgi:transposase InsO family protein
VTTHTRTLKLFLVYLEENGKIQKNVLTHSEPFNSLVRRECLSQHWFVDLRDAQKVLDRWRLDYNTVRPHGRVRRSTPAQKGAGAPITPSPERLRNLHP